MTQVSIIIVCMNRPDNLYSCLESIQKHCKADYEVLLVAYLFSEDNLLKAKRDFPWVQFIESNEIRGFSENNNLALRRARGRYCFILNDDTIMTSDVISQLISDFETLPESAAILTPCLLNSDESLQLCGRPDYPAYKYVLQQWHLYREPIDDTTGKNPIVGSVYKTSNISGAAFLIKTETFRELGFFDECYFFTPEDIALSTLARRRGYGVYVDKAANIIHKWRTTASKLSIAVRPASIRGSLIFFSDGSSLRYFLLGLGVWLAEASKLLKARLLYLFDKSEVRHIQLLTFKANCSAIFTRLSPKQLFIKMRPRS